MNKKLIYQFSSTKTEGDRSMLDLLGGKGANLAEMSNLGINVPPGFTVTTEVCNYFIENKSFPDKFDKELEKALTNLEKITKKKFNDDKIPLLLSVRSGGKVSMPGMMDSILNIGINDKNVDALAANFNDERFALDSYRRLIQMYGNVVLEIEMDRFEAIIDNKKRIDGVEKDNDFNSEQLIWIIDAFKTTVERFAGNPFPQDPVIQLKGAIEAVFKSWLNKRAVTYRKINNIPNNWGTGTTIQSMVFGNLNESSGTGVAFTRFPSTGKNKLYGEYLMNAQGEDVVAGIRTPYPIGKHEKNTQPSLEEKNPVLFNEIKSIGDKLETHYKDAQDIEFTIEDGELFILQMLQPGENIDTDLRSRYLKIVENDKVFQRIGYVGPEYYNFDSPNPSVDCCPGRGYEDNHTDFIWEYQNVSANDQVGEVIEHLLHTITGVGFAREFPEWNWYDENSKIYLAMNEAVEKNIYDISSYQEIKNNGDMEGYNKVTVQEFSFWVIVTSWGYSDIYDLPHGEFKISSINQVRTELPIAFELYVDTIEKILTVPDKDFLKSLFS